jgi:hypothetical protein
LDKEKLDKDKDKSEQRDKERERERIRQWAKERERAEEKKLLKEKKGITIPLILPSLESMKSKAAASASRASSVTPVLTAQSPKESQKSVPPVVSPRSMSREERKLAEELALFERMEREEKKTKHRTTRKRQQSGVLVPADADLKMKHDTFDSMSEIDAQDSSQMNLLGLFRRDSAEPDSMSSGQSILDSEQMRTEEDSQSTELTKRKIESLVIETLLQEPVFKRPKVEFLIQSDATAIPLPHARTTSDDLPRASSIPPSSPMITSPVPMPETPSEKMPVPVIATPAPMVRKLSLKELLQKRGKNNSSSNLVSPSGTSPPSTPLLKDAENADKEHQEDHPKNDE